MAEIDRWLAEYGDSHRKIANPTVYWPAVIMLVPGMTGMLWSLPVPEAFVLISPVLNWGTAFLMAALVYYFIISLPLAVGMLPFMFIITGLGLLLNRSGTSIAGVSLVLIVLSVTGLIVGRRSSGGLSAVLHDIQLMMIGPLWLLSEFYRRLGIPY